MRIVDIEPVIEGFELGLAQETDPFMIAATKAFILTLKEEPVLEVVDGKIIIEEKQGTDHE